MCCRRKGHQTQVEQEETERIYVVGGAHSNLVAPANARGGVQRADRVWLATGRRGDANRSLVSVKRNSRRDRRPLRLKIAAKARELRGLGVRVSFRTLKAAGFGTGTVRAYFARAAEPDEDEEDDDSASDDDDSSAEELDEQHARARAVGLPASAVVPRPLPMVRHSVRRRRAPAPPPPAAGPPSGRAQSRAPGVAGPKHGGRHGGKSCRERCGFPGWRLGGWVFSRRFSRQVDGAASGERVECKHNGDDEMTHAEYNDDDGAVNSLLSHTRTR
jgi:hypothetical protein